MVNYARAFSQPEWGEDKVNYIKKKINLEKHNFPQSSSSSHGSCHSVDSGILQFVIIYASYYFWHMVLDSALYMPRSGALPNKRILNPWNKSKEEHHCWS